MNKVIDILVNNKVAVQTNDVVYVCNNSDFVINFTFDAEWDEFTHKTARFVYNDCFVDVLFTGNECAVPSVISDTFKFFVGVFAGELKTTTPALVSAKKSILCDGGSPAKPTPDVYSQLLAELDLQKDFVITMIDGKEGYESLDKTYDEILEAWKSGKNPCIKISDDSGGFHFYFQGFESDDKMVFTSNRYDAMDIPEASANGMLTIVLSKDNTLEVKENYFVTLQQFAKSLDSLSNEIGDINTALDTIIEIQNELLGGE